MTVVGLRPGASYTFYLAAANAVGVGESVKFRVQTPPPLRRTQSRYHNNRQQSGTQYTVNSTITVHCCTERT